MIFHLLIVKPSETSWFVEYHRIYDVSVLNVADSLTLCPFSESWHGSFSVHVP